MNHDARQWACVIRGSGTLVGGEARGRVGVTSGNDSEALSRESRTQALREGQGYVLLECAVWKMGAGVGAAVRWVKQDEIAIKGGKRFRWSRDRLLWLGRKLCRSWRLRFERGAAQQQSRDSHEDVVAAMGHVLRILA